MAIEWASFFRKKTPSSETAKDRLKLVLIQDRINCSDDVLEKIKSDIIEVLAKYAEIDMDELNLEMSKVDKDSDKKAGNPVLLANIPIKNMKRMAEVE